MNFLAMVIKCEQVNVNKVCGLPYGNKSNGRLLPSLMGLFNEFDGNFKISKSCHRHSIVNGSKEFKNMQKKNLCYHQVCYYFKVYHWQSMLSPEIEILKLYC